MVFKLSKIGVMVKICSFNGRTYWWLKIAKKNSRVETKNINESMIQSNNCNKNDLISQVINDIFLYSFRQWNEYKRGDERR